MTTISLKEKINLWIILASATLTVMAGAVIAPVINQIREGTGTDPSSVGLIITTHALFIAIFSPLVGILIDKVGTKKVFIFGMIFYGLAGGSGSLITSFWLLLLSRAILGIATAAIFNSIAVMILNLYVGDERNKMMGWRSSANSLGGIIWPLIGGLVGSLSWHLPFLVYLISIPIGIVAALFMKETQAAQKDNEEKTSLIKIFKNNLSLLAFFGILFWNFVLLYTIIVFLPQKLGHIGIFNPEKIGVFISLLAGAAGVVSLFYNKIKSKLSYKNIALLAIVFWAVGFLALSQTSLLIVISFSVIAFGIGQGLILPAVMVFIGETVEASFRGRVMSYTGTFTYLGQFAAPVIWGPLLLVLGFDEIFLIASLVCVLFFALFLKLMKNK